MEKPELIVTPRVGETFRQALHFSTAIRIGNWVEISGQDDWNDDQQIRDQSGCTHSRSSLMPDFL